MAAVNILYISFDGVLAVEMVFLKKKKRIWRKQSKESNIKITRNISIFYKRTLLD